MTSQLVHIYVPDEMRQMLRRTAFEYDVSVNQVVRVALVYAFYQFGEGEYLDYDRMLKAVQTYILEEENDGGMDNG